MAKIGIAVFALNQLALDFNGNCHRIIKSIKMAKDLGATIRIGPELEVCGYSCDDAFFEQDTVYHSWQTVASIIQENFKNILIDIGLPVYKDGCLYNCRLSILNNRILMIRPKTRMANDGCYRETRWFSPWGDTPSSSGVVYFPLPSFVAKLTGQYYIPFGSDIVLDFIPASVSGVISRLLPFRIGFEICEEMWVTQSTNVSLYGERGVSLIINGSGSYWEIRKLDRALDLVTAATAKSGGIYAFSNLVGCDGSRVCFFGRSMVVLNGKVVARSTSEETFLNDIDCAFYWHDPLDIVNYRQQNSFKYAPHRGSGARLIVDASKTKVDELEPGPMDGSQDLVISIHNFNLYSSQHGVSLPIQLDFILPEQEIMIYSSLWLWDYIRRCHSWCKGFMLPLSGGIDSAAVCCIVYVMCTYLYKHCKREIKATTNPSFLKALSSIVGTPLEQLRGPKDICNKILRCCFLRTKYSGRESEARAAALAKLCGAQFCVVDFTAIYEATDKLTNETLQRPSTHGVSIRMQNLQARLRMCLTYDLSEGNRLVLATGNVDEALVGYLTKYDCSSADLNPIGGLSKQDLRRFCAYVKDKILKENPAVLQRILDAIPSAELTGENQSDEADLELTYLELSLFGKLRRGEFGCCGPYGVFCKLLDNAELYNQPPDPELIAKKVKRFFTLFARNRHKGNVLTPALHAENYSPDDNRFDHRQLLFDTNWRRQFASIDERVAKETGRKPPKPNDVGLKSQL